MSERPTPETDSLFWENGYPVKVDSSKAMQLCEKLEKERDWIAEKFKLLEGCFKRAERERDEAREQNAKLRMIAEMAIKLLTNPSAISVFPTLAMHNEEHGKSLRAELEKLNEEPNARKIARTPRSTALFAVNCWAYGSVDEPTISKALAENRVVKITPTEDGKFEVLEMCDEYYGATLPADQLAEWGRELIALSSANAQADPRKKEGAK
jgi:hypothetical protein